MWHGLRRALLCVFLYNLLTKTTLVPFLMRIYAFFVRHYACTAETAISSEGWQLWTLRWLQTPVFFFFICKKKIIFFLHTTAYPVKWPYCAAKKNYNLLIHEMQEPLVKHFSQRPQFFIRQWVHWVKALHFSDKVHQDSVIFTSLYQSQDKPHDFPWSFEKRKERETVLWQKPLHKQESWLDLIVTEDTPLPNHDERHTGLAGYQNCAAVISLHLVSTRIVMPSIIFWLPHSQTV